MSHLTERELPPLSQHLEIIDNIIALSGSRLSVTDAVSLFQNFSEPASFAQLNPLTKKLDRRQFLKTSWQAGLGLVTGQVPGLGLLAEFFGSNGDALEYLLRRIALGKDILGPMGPAVIDTFGRDNPNPFMAYGSLTKLSSMGWLLLDKLGEINPGLLEDIPWEEDDSFARLSDRLTNKSFVTSVRPTNMVMDLIAQTMFNEHMHLSVESLWILKESPESLFWNYEVGEQPPKEMEEDDPEFERISEREINKIYDSGLDNGLDMVNVEGFMTREKRPHPHPYAPGEDVVRYNITIPVLQNPEKLSSHLGILTSVARECTSADIDHFPQGVQSLQEKRAAESSINRFVWNNYKKTLHHLRNATYLLSGLGSFGNK